MNTIFKLTALAAASATLATAAPAAAATSFAAAGASPLAMQAVPGTETYNQYRDWNGDGRWDRDRRWDRDGRYSRDDWRRGYRNSYREPSRVWRGNNGRYYCRRDNGTTGLLVGGAVGALLGRGLDGGRDRTIGTVLGAAGGALLGREVDRGGSRCR